MARKQKSSAASLKRKLAAHEREDRGFQGAVRRALKGSPQAPSPKESVNNGLRIRSDMRGK